MRLTGRQRLAGDAAQSRDQCVEIGLRTATGPGLSTMRVLQAGMGAQVRSMFSCENALSQNADGWAGGRPQRGLRQSRGGSPKCRSREDVMLLARNGEDM